MKKTFIFILVLGALVISCRKELPILPSGDAPVFYVEMNHANLNVNLKAGVLNVTFEEETQTEQLVKFYSGILAKQDTSFRFNFFAGEVFKQIQLSDFEGISTISPIYLNTQILTSIEIGDLTESQFDEANFSINGQNNLTVFNFEHPGIYNIQTQANRNGFEYNVTNQLVIGYDNPYKFELKGNINNAGPGIILEGEILHLSQNIQRIEWTCGSNTQTTTGNFVQFPTANSANELTAKVFFSDGVTRTRTIGLGIQSAPIIQDLVYLLENTITPNFTNKFEIVMTANGVNYSSRNVTEFSSGAPYLTILNKTIYTDPVTNQQAYLIQASGLVYLKNEQTNEVLALPITLQIGLPVVF